MPEETKVVSARELMGLVDVARGVHLGCDVAGLTVGESHFYLLLPHVYEVAPVPAWRCRVIAFYGGLSAEMGEGERMGLGRLDIAVDDYRRLRPAPRKVERQLLHWLAWKAVEAVRKAAEDQ
ncbi:hypothetical protein BJ973_008004 [Actinoplanes tereljensis]|uniref:hypothetical protein n=1 Tax=Paractinoplanes tereljensis TaxID=571912 RepID=UPI00194333C0|nr:hypothetical protein [Actinoplanes tereljensis]